MPHRCGPEDGEWSMELWPAPQWQRCLQTRACHCETVPLDSNPSAHLCKARHTHHQMNNEPVVTDAAVYLRTDVVQRRTACARFCLQQLCALPYFGYDRGVRRRDTTESSRLITT